MGVVRPSQGLLSGARLTVCTVDCRIKLKKHGCYLVADFWRMLYDVSDDLLRVRLVLHEAYGSAAEVCPHDHGGSHTDRLIGSVYHVSHEKTLDKL